MIQTYDERATLYLADLRSLAKEMTHAIECIASNAMPDLVESVERQLSLTQAIEHVVARKRRANIGAQLNHVAAQRSPVDLEIETAWQDLRDVTAKYSALLSHSGSSLSQLLLLCKSMSGQIPGAGPSLMEHQTWCCEA